MEDEAGQSGLDVDDGDAVGDHIVRFTGDPDAFLGDLTPARTACSARSCRVSSPVPWAPYPNGHSTSGKPTACPTTGAIASAPLPTPA
ncbi:hypothetical protein ACIQ6R_22040 [Streptomyces sp. NPDC096048]|uniref:hypothetical protein n=1 Tax=Streptomyces sp. NPDC096048 TaxID=3366072 RepID=UPI0038058577